MAKGKRELEFDMAWCPKTRCTLAAISEPHPRHGSITMQAQSRDDWRLEYLPLDQKGRLLVIGDCKWVTREPTAQ